MKAMEMAIPLALASRDWDCLGKARAELGTAWVFAGDYSNAVDCFLAYLLDYRHYQTAARYLGTVHYNLALAYRRRKDNLRAVEHYKEALEWFSERGHTLMSGKTHQNLAWLYCLEQNLEAAEAEIQLAQTFAEALGAEFKTEQLICRAFLHMLRKEILEAVKLTQEVLQDGRPGTTETQRAHAYWLCGRVALAIYDLDTAQAMAELATRHALLARDPSAMSLASSLKAEVARRRQKNDEAAG
jgi:tetratricopeptide (TPR) repeat protein